MIPLKARLRYELIHLWGLATGMRFINIGHAPGGADGGVPTIADLNEWGCAVYQALWADIKAGAERLPGAGQRRGLELGCGQGAAFGLLGNSGACGWTGIDLSVTAAAIARSRGHRVRVAANQAIPFADRSFDAIVAVEAVLLFRNAQAVFQEMARVLAPCGSIGLAEFRGAPIADARARIEALCATSGLACRSFVDRTAVARQAVIRGLPARTLLASRLPAFARASFAETLQLASSQRYQRWVDGTMCYWHAVLTHADGRGDAENAGTETNPSAEVPEP